MTAVLPDANRANWVDRYAPSSLQPWLKLGRFDRPAGIWLLMLPGWQGIALAGAANWATKEGNSLNLGTGAVSLGGATRINSDAGLLTLDVASGNAITGTHDLTFGGAGNITVADVIATSTGNLSAEDVRRAPGVQEDVVRAVALFPGVAISLAVFGTNLFGDALRDILDPTQRGRG